MPGIYWRCKSKEVTVLTPMGLVSYVGYNLVYRTIIIQPCEVY